LVLVQLYAIHFELLKDGEFTDQPCNHKLGQETLAPRSEPVAVLALQKLFFLVFGRGGAHSVREVSRGKIRVLYGPPASHRYSSTCDSLPAINKLISCLLCRSSDRCCWDLKHCNIFRA
jgi:hypothetical protein